MTGFNPELIGTVVSMGNELAWPKADLEAVFHELEANDYAVLGAECWVVRPASSCSKGELKRWVHHLGPDQDKQALVLAATGEYVIYGGLPTRERDEPSFNGWSVSSREDAESWEMFVKRSLEESREILWRMAVEDEVIPEFADRVFYCVSYVDEGEYESLDSG